MQIRQLLFEVFSVGLPRHAVDAWRRVSLKCAVTLLQEVDGDVMQQCGEPHILTLSRRTAHAGKSDRRGVPAQCPGRGGLAAVPLGRGPSSAASAEGAPSLFGCFIGLIPSSDFSSANMLIVWLLPS